LSEDKIIAKPHQSNFGGLLLATVLSVIGACAMAGSILLQSFTRRFPATGNFVGNFNVPRPFNATRTFMMQIPAQRVTTGFAYGSWLNILGFACLLAVTIIVVVLLLQSR
jgi:hypothetical protein